MLTPVHTFTADGNSPAWAAISPMWYCLTGTFNGGTARLQASPDGGVSWADVGAETELTEPGWMAVSLPTGTMVRVVLAGAVLPSIVVHAA